MNTIPPEERQTIVVATEDKLAEVCGNVLFKNISKSWKNLPKTSRLAADNLKDYFRINKKGKLIEALRDSLLNPFQQTVYYLDSPDILNKLELVLGNELAWYPFEEAKALFRFNNGALPSNGAVYCKHPLDNNHYLTPSSANIYLADEKVYAFTRLASALGAKKVSVDISHLATQKMNTTATYKELVTNISSAFNSQSNQDSKLSVYREYDKPKHKPFVPSELQGWLNSDFMFKSMAIERIDHGLKKQKVTLDIKQMSTINAATMSQFIGYGIDVGGQYESFKNHSYIFFVEYW